MEAAIPTNSKRFLRTGTDLILGTSHRHVRVLQLPRVCFPCKILAAWNRCFGFPHDLRHCDINVLDSIDID